MHIIQGTDDTDRRTFLRVIETGALTAASRELRTDVSTISRRIASLEVRLGVKLIERAPRRSIPTAAGLRYSEALRRLIDEQDALEADLRGEATVPRGLLRVACPTNLGERHLTGLGARLPKTVSGRDDRPSAGTIDMSTCAASISTLRSA